MIGSEVIGSHPPPKKKKKSPLAPRHMCAVVVCVSGWVYMMRAVTAHSITGKWGWEGDGLTITTHTHTHAQRNGHTIQGQKAENRWPKIFFFEQSLATSGQPLFYPPSFFLIPSPPFHPHVFGGRFKLGQAETLAQFPLLWPIRHCTLAQ